MHAMGSPNVTTNAAGYIIGGALLSGVAAALAVAAANDDAPIFVVAAVVAPIALALTLIGAIRAGLATQDR
jgi:hypothetical protein